MILGQLDILMQKNEWGPPHTTYCTKTNSKIDHRPISRDRNYKLLEENIRAFIPMFHDLGLGSQRKPTLYLEVPTESLPSLPGSYPLWKKVSARNR